MDTNTLPDTATHYSIPATYHSDRAICEANGWTVSSMTMLEDGRIMLTLIRTSVLTTK